MYRTKYAVVAAVLSFGIIVVIGCGKGRQTTAQVTGRVTCQGRPVPEGRIMFHPEKGRPALGTLGPDGTYRLTTFDKNDGAAPGKYRVTIDAKQVSGGAPPPKSIQDEIRAGASSAPPTVKWLVPEKYSNPETSDLTAEVKPGPNVIDFDL